PNRKSTEPGPTRRSSKSGVMTRRRARSRSPIRSRSVSRLRRLISLAIVRERCSSRRPYPRRVLTLHFPAREVERLARRPPYLPARRHKGYEAIRRERCGAFRLAFRRDVGLAGSGAGETPGAGLFLIDRPAE